jgi:hypothetical protein
MLKKQDLLNLAESMNLEPDDEKFYRFLQNFTLHLSQANQTDSKPIFQCLEYCSGNLKKVKNHFGISGDNTYPLKRWCNYMLIQKNDLQKLSVTELNYVFACCARICKAKKP